MNSKRPKHHVPRALFGLPRPGWQRAWPFKTYLVNTEYRFLYCPIPKVACTSIKHWFATVTLAPDVLREGGDLHSAVKERCSLACHSSSEARGMLEDYYKFAVIREPLARLESAFIHKFVGTHQATEKKLTIPVIEWVHAHVRNHKVSRTQPYAYRDGSGREYRLLIDPGIDYVKSISFEEFVTYVCEHRNGQLNQHWRPQRDFLRSDGFHVFDLARLQEATTAIADELGLEAIQLPTLNASREPKAAPSPTRDRSQVCAGELRPIRNEIATLYTPDLKRRVQHRYASDVELFQSVTSART